MNIKDLNMTSTSQTSQIKNLTKDYVSLTDNDFGQIGLNTDEISAITWFFFSFNKVGKNYVYGLVEIPSEPSTNFRTANKIDITSTHPLDLLDISKIHQFIQGRDLTNAVILPMIASSMLSLESESRHVVGLSIK